MTTASSTTAARVLKIVRFTPGVTRADLAHRMNIAVTTVNPVVAQLVDQGVIDEATTDQPRGVGRPRTGLRVNGRTDTLGTIVWSHGVLAIALAGFDNRIIWTQRIEVEGPPSAEQVIAAAQQLFEEAAMRRSVHEPYALVLGLPAPYERGVGVGGARSGHDDVQFSRWFDQDPLELLSERFKVPVLVENDANLGALGETRHGAGSGQKCIIYVKLSGHGIGSGITINGNLFSGSHGFAGEIAHVRIDDASQVICVCGSRGCLEEKLGGAMLAPLQPTYGTDLTWDKVLGMVNDELPGPLRILVDAGRLVGRALADMSTYLNPNLLVLDAGSRTASDVFRSGVEEQIGQSAPPFIRDSLSVVSSTTGDQAPLLGAIEIARAASIGSLRR